jgi:hypothetical protein
MNEIISQHKNILNKLILEDKKEDRYDWEQM